MPKKKILYISGSVGLGHVTRDLAIARELRRQNPEVELLWLACPPASMLIKDAGERLLHESDQWANENIPLENAAQGGYHLNLMHYIIKSRKDWAHNVKLFKKVAENEQFGLVIGDETYEIQYALENKSLVIDSTFVIIRDFVGLDSVTKNPLDKLLCYLAVIKLAKLKDVPETVITKFFVGQEEDVPDKKFGFLLPNRRDYAKKRFKFLGYIVQFDPAEYADKEKVRTKLGYGKEPLIICSIGGTTIGKELLDLCGKAYPTIRKEIPSLRMVLVCGPRLSPDSLHVPEGVEVREYVPALYEHFAASDLAIIQGGGTSTIELTALRRPFLYFPLEKHCEQQLYVSGRLARHQAGIRMQYSQTTPEALAEMVIANIGKEVTYPPIPTDGAQKAVQLINQLL